MPINQDQINLLLDRSNLSTESNRVFIFEKGNMMTAIQWFTRITGQRLSLGDINRRRADGGFFIHTYQGVAEDINVNLRGGSSSSITTNSLTVLMTHDYRFLDQIESSSVTAGCPTIDITNPQNLGQVPRVLNCEGRIEIKFTTTYRYVQ